MSEDAEDAQVGVIRAARYKNGAAVSLRTWLVSKLGTTMGERLFKELAAFSDMSTQDLPGKPAVVLDTAGGRIVSVQFQD